MLKIALIIPPRQDPDWELEDMELGDTSTSIAEGGRWSRVHG